MKRVAPFGVVLMVALAGAVVQRVADTTSQQQRPVFAGVPSGVLENAGIHLTLPTQARGLLSQSAARVALEAEYGGASSRIKEMALANLEDGDCSGPAWGAPPDPRQKGFAPLHSPFSAAC